MKLKFVKKLNSKVIYFVGNSYYSVPNEKPALTTRRAGSAAKRLKQYLKSNKSTLYMDIIERGNIDELEAIGD